MKDVKVVTMSLQALRERKDDLLAVGEVDAERLARGQVLRREIRSALFSARTIATLAALLVQRTWIPVFYLAGNRVFVAFEANDLLAGSRGSVRAVVRELEYFSAWSEAALRVATCGGDVDVDPACAGLDAFRRRRIGGHSVHETFLRWTRKVARTGAAMVNVGTVDGPMLTLNLPPRIQLLTPVPQPTPGGEPHLQSRRYEVLSTRRCKLLMTSAGRLLLSGCRHGKSPMIGARLRYPESAARGVGGYYLVR